MYEERISHAGREALPVGWTWTTLGEVSQDPQYGWTTKAASAGDLRLLRTSDITSDHIDWDSVPYCSDGPSDVEDYLVHDGDVVISRAGSVGVSSLIKRPPKAVFASYLIRFRPLVDEGYFSFYLDSPDYWQAISEKKLGIAVPNVNASKLTQVCLPLAPLHEQRRIVAKIEELFSQLDAGVEELKKAKAQLKRYRQSVLKTAFEGKLTEEWRKKNLTTKTQRHKETAQDLLVRIREERKKALGTKYKDPPPLDTSELPQLPAEWTWARLGMLATKITDGVHKTPNYTSEGFPFLSVNSISDSGVIDFTGCKHVSPEEHREFTKRCDPKYGDVLLSKVGTVGLTAMVKTPREFSLFVNTAQLRPDTTAVSAGYLTHAIRHGFLSGQYSAYVGGSTQRFIGIGKIGLLPIPVASLAEQAEIVSEVERRLSIVDAEEKAIEAALAQAARLRQSILKRAFEGRLVPQDPSDEPADRLLERIRAEKAKHAAAQPRGRGRR